jgi:putative oxidoreductase
MFKSIHHRYSGLAGAVRSLVLLAMRLYWGFLFMQAGAGKLANIDAPTKYFESLGIFFPNYAAYLVGYVEMIGGICLIVGIFSRLVSIPLIITMITAFFTAHLESVLSFFKAIPSIYSSPDTFISAVKGITEQMPFLFLLTVLLVFGFGAGKFSIDYLFCLIARKLRGKKEAAVEE